MIPGYGLGIDSDVVGGYAAYGLGIKSLGGGINAFISFATDMDLDLLNTKTINQDVSFNVDLLLSIILAGDIDTFISFATEMDLNVLNNKTTSKDISFNIDLLLNALEDLQRNQSIQFDIESAINIATQANYNPEVPFNILLDEIFVKELIADKSISLDTELSADIAGFLLKFLLKPGTVHTISEELRFLKIFMEQRSCQISEDIRIETIKFEDRMVVILPSEDEEI